MTRQEAHKLVDKLFDGREFLEESQIITTKVEDLVIGETLCETSARMEETEQTERELPKDKRVVRTKTSGDRVYLLDEEKKTRQWITNPEVLKSLGFEITDVTEVEDSELLRFQMGPALYKVDGNS